MKNAWLALAVAAALPGAAAADLAADYAAVRAQVQTQAPIDVPASPSSVRFACNDRFDEILPTFWEREDGSYAVELLLRFRGSAGRYTQERWKSLGFELQAGRLERDGQRLLYVKDGRGVAVAQTKWWYEPKWYPTKNAQVRERMVRLTPGLCEISEVALVVRP